MNEQNVNKPNTSKSESIVTSAYEWVGAAVIALTVVASLFF